jgi:hypothetical protein
MVKESAFREPRVARVFTIVGLFLAVSSPSSSTAANLCSIWLSKTREIVKENLFRPTLRQSEKSRSVGESEETTLEHAIQSASFDNETREMFETLVSKYENKYERQPNLVMRSRESFPKQIDNKIKEILVLSRSFNKSILTGYENGFNAIMFSSGEILFSNNYTSHSAFSILREDILPALDQLIEQIKDRKIGDAPVAFLSFHTHPSGHLSAYIPSFGDLTFAHFEKKYLEDKGIKNVRFYFYVVPVNALLEDKLTYFQLE